MPRTERNEGRAHEFNLSQEGRDMVPPCHSRLQTETITWSHCLEPDLMIAAGKVFSIQESNAGKPNMEHRGCNTTSKGFNS